MLKVYPRRGPRPRRVVPSKASMPLWKITLSYDGTSFHGWQIQPGLATVQGTLAGALYRVTGEHVLPQGAGRTDAGVHALGQVASVALRCPIPAANLQRALNAILPAAIRVLAVEERTPPFHARHSAREKTYQYRIFPRLPVHTAASASTRHPTTRPPDRICSPTLAPFVWDCAYPLALDALNQSAAVVCGTHDFTSFAATAPASEAAPYQPLDPLPDYAAVPPTSCRTLTASHWQLVDDLLIYTVTGSGFLHHMVRNLVGTFVLAGSGRIAPASIADILATRSRSAAGPTAPARGLFLVSVRF